MTLNITEDVCTQKRLKCKFISLTSVPPQTYSMTPISRQRSRLLVDEDLSVATRRTELTFLLKAHSSRRHRGTKTGNIWLSALSLSNQAWSPTASIPVIKSNTHPHHAEWNNRPAEWSVWLTTDFSTPSNTCVLYGLAWRKHWLFKLY